MYSDRSLASVKADVDKRVSALIKRASQKGIPAFKDQARENSLTTNYEAVFEGREEGLKGTVSFKVHQAEGEVLIMIAHDFSVYSGSREKELGRLAETLVDRAYASFETEEKDSSNPATSPSQTHKP